MKTMELERADTVENLPAGWMKVHGNCMEPAIMEGEYVFASDDTAIGQGDMVSAEIEVALPICGGSDYQPPVRTYNKLCRTFNLLGKTHIICDNGDFFMPLLRKIFNVRAITHRRRENFRTPVPVHAEARLRFEAAKKLVANVSPLRKSSYQLREAQVVQIAAARKIAADLGRKWLEQRRRRRVEFEAIDISGVDLKQFEPDRSRRKRQSSPRCRRKGDEK
jgi:hypothetical protein